MGDSFRDWTYYSTQEGNVLSSSDVERRDEQAFLGRMAQFPFLISETDSRTHSPHTPTNTRLQMSQSYGPYAMSSGQTLPSNVIRSLGSLQATQESSPTMDTASSPAKKRKSRNISDKGKGLSMADDVEAGDKKGGGNKRWLEKHTQHLFEILVEEEARGNKPQKRYKQCSINRAAAEVNDKFGESYTAENVNNHLKSWKKKWVEMCQARDLSGAGWDDVEKKVVLEGDSFRDLVRVSFINHVISFIGSLSSYLS